MYPQSISEAYAQVLQNLLVPQTRPADDNTVDARGCNSSHAHLFHGATAAMMER